MKKVIQVAGLALLGFGAIGLWAQDAADTGSFST